MSVLKLMFLTLSVAAADGAECMDVSCTDSNSMLMSQLGSKTSEKLEEDGDDQATTAGTVYILDFFNGYTQVNQMGYAFDQTVVAQSTGSKAPALRTALQDAPVRDELIQAIKEYTPSGTVYSFATAGIRTALEDGTITQESLDSFGVELKQQLGPRAKFQMLSQLDEAETELAALKHVLFKNLSSPKIDGMWNCGGMSCQFAFYKAVGDLHGNLTLDAFTNFVLDPKGVSAIANSEPDEAFTKKLEEALETERDRVTKEIAGIKAKVRLGRGKKLYGNFATSGWMADTIASPGLGFSGPPGERLGLNFGYNSLVPVKEVLEAMKNTSRWALTQDDSVSKLLWQEVALWNMATVVLEELFHQRDAKLYILPGADLKVGYVVENNLTDSLPQMENVKKNDANSKIRMSMLVVLALASALCWSRLTH